MDKLFAKLGISRDDAKWLWTQIVSGAALLTVNVADLPISDSARHKISVACAVILWFGGKMATSPLYGKNDMPVEVKK